MTMSVGRIVRRFIHYLVPSELSEGNSKIARFRKCIFKILYFEFNGGLMVYFRVLGRLYIKNNFLWDIRDVDI